jgi:CBS domain-containing protein
MSKIREILDRKGGAVLSTDFSTSVREAIGIMSEANVGAIVVTEQGQAVGIFTERDYMRKIALQGRSSKDTPLQTVMSSPLITVVPEDSTDSAMETMTTCRCRHLIVVEGEEMRGIVSLGDLVKQLLVDREAEVEQLSHYIAGSY